MEAVFAIFIAVLVYITIKGFIQTKDDERKYRNMIQGMTTLQIKIEQGNLRSQIRHIPNTVIRKNSDAGMQVRYVQIRNAIIKKELKRRGEV